LRPREIAVKFPNFRIADLMARLLRELTLPQMNSPVRKFVGVTPIASYGLLRRKRRGAACMTMTGRRAM